jgi:hypothetical protein
MLGLIRQGWSYLSDDALLIHQQDEVSKAGLSRKVRAFALRKPCYIDSSAAARYTEFSLGQEVPDSSARPRRAVRVEEAYPLRQLPACSPKVVLFTTIGSQQDSTLRPVDRVTAIKHLLNASGPQIFDRHTMSRHLATLNTLVDQVDAYELVAGWDLYRSPAKLPYLLEETKRENSRWRASSWS